MRHGSLFSGIGGFDLAAEWMGWENVFHCEWMEFPRKVLDYYFPNADSHIDICKTDFKKYANKIDILTGGFPCQPFSMAGKRKGTDDERYLWGEMLRAVQEIKPKFVIAENVFGITNIDGGMVFEQVCLDLETEGYEVQPFIIPSASKNAPHRRDRVWFVAFNTNSIRSATFGKVCKGKDNESIRVCYEDRDASTDTKNIRRQGCTWRTENWKGDDLGSEINHRLGTRSHLNPRYNAERGGNVNIGAGRILDQKRVLPTQDDGLPTKLTELPFLNGERNQLKDTETP
jgi:DNA-cytosine methyltransferase